MIRRQRILFLLGATACVFAATSMLSTGPTHSQAAGASEETAHFDRVEVQKLVIEGQQPHWSEKYLENLSADSNLNQSIYLSAVQLTQIERDAGDVKRAIPYLETLVTRTPDQTLKNALRRLIADIYREEENDKMQENQLKKIIDESLLQM